jgi:hypothetical protein
VVMMQPRNIVLTYLIGEEVGVEEMSEPCSHSKTKVVTFEEGGYSRKIRVCRACGQMMELRK